MLPDAFWLLHDGLARQAPGSEASTLKAIRHLPALPAGPRILDLGCGPGPQTLVLARELGAPLTAIDIHQPFLDQLNRRAADRGLAHLVETRNLSMDALDYPAESVDLIWCEGAIYLLGVAAALRAWRPLLRPGGLVAFTECTWLTNQPPAEAAAFWSQAHPAMTTLAGNTALANDTGFEVTATFPLPPEDWWNEYYAPLQARIDRLRGRASGDAELHAVLDETQREIEVFAQYGDSYGYVFYLARRREPPA